MDRKLSGLNPLSYRGVNAYTPPELVIHKRAPTTKDHLNFMIGTIWLDSNNNPPDSSDIYMLVDIANQTSPLPPIATWVSFAGGGTGPQTLEGNTGGPVSPDGLNNTNIFSGIAGLDFDGNPGTNTITLNNSSGNPLLQTLSDDIGTKVAPNLLGDIGLLGTSGHVTTTSNPGAHSIVIDIAGDFGDKFKANDGNTAIPTAGNLNILGNGNIYTTVPAADTIQIDLIGTTNHALQLGNASGSLTSLGVATNGQLPIGSAGANPVLSTLTAGSGISVTNGPGSISISVNAATLPSFQAYSNLDTIPNVTGDGTIAVIIYDSITLDNPAPGNFNTATGEYIIPEDGLYFFHFNCGYKGNLAGTGGLQWNMQIAKNGITVIGQGGGMPTQRRVANFLGPNNSIDMCISGIISCSLGDSITTTVTGSGGAKTDGLQGSNGNPGAATTFSGYLIGNI